LSPEQLQGLQRTFPLYVKFPKSRWPEIREAEALTPEGDATYATLAEEYRRESMKWPSAIGTQLSAQSSGSFRS
jgi:hypothetical protein